MHRLLAKPDPTQKYGHNDRYSSSQQTVTAICMTDRTLLKTLLKMEILGIYCLLSNCSNVFAKPTVYTREIPQVKPLTISRYHMKFSKI